MDDHIPLDISASDSILQAGIGERVKLVPPSTLVLKPVQDPRGKSQPPHEKLVCESESLNLHDPSARTALCVCVVKQRKETSSLDSTPIFLHPYLVRQFAATENYVFTEHCPLGSLEEYLRPDTIVPVVAWATQLCSALSYLHSKGFAHGHLLPSSVQVAEGGQSLRLGNLESVVRFAGTPPNLDAHARDDVYKLGCLFLFIENGGKPNKDHTMPVHLQSLQLGDPISRCWAGVDVRPSSHELLEVLQSFGPLDGNVSPLPFQPVAGQPPHGRPGISSAARLGVVKLTLWREHSTYSPAEDFANERAFIAQVQPVHPNIVRYFAVTDYFLFMECHPLGSLEAYIKPSVSPPVLRWTIQLCSALVYLHDLGYAHNQVYPCNILVASGGDALKLCDFGTVTLAQDFVGGSYPNSPEVEQAFNAYSDDPELWSIRGDLSDVYSLGLIIWFLQNGGAEPPDNRILMYDDGCPYPRVLGARSHLDILDVSGLFLGDLMQMCWVPQTNRLPSREVLDHLVRVKAQESPDRSSRLLVSYSNVS